MAKIFIEQTFTVVRRIELEVEGTADESLDSWEGGTLDTPDYDDPRWVEKTRSLKMEEANEVTES